MKRHILMVVTELFLVVALAVAAAMSEIDLAVIVIAIILAGLSLADRIATFWSTRA